MGRKSWERHYAEADFKAAKGEAHDDVRVGLGGPTRDKSARMRNAWVAYHAGASWMNPDHAAIWDALAGQERAEAQAARLRAEVERLRGVLRYIEAGSPKPQWVTFTVRDALSREDGGE